MPSTTQPESGRRRSLSGALTRRFTRNSTSTAPPSESTAKRRATIATTTSDNAQVHVRIVPNIDNPSRSLIFDIVDRVLTVGSVIRIGRYSERHANQNCMSFKSKVVSRCHCEVWVETDGKLYIRDTKSSSGTFLNHVRLSPAGNESGPVELHDGDIVQLGVDFQGGREEIYRSVKMKFELNRSSTPRPLSFNINAFQNLRNLTQPNHITTPPALSSSLEKEEYTTNVHPTVNIKDIPATACHEDIDECCICLYALAPFQALFVSPCSHTYHFKCIRPLLQSYPGFQCPICRTYSDLEASVALDEAVENLHERSNTISITAAPLVGSELSLQSTTSDLNPLTSRPDSASPLAASSEAFEAPVIEERLNNPTAHPEDLPNSTTNASDIINNHSNNNNQSLQANDQQNLSNRVFSNTEEANEPVRDQVSEEPLTMAVNTTEAAATTTDSRKRERRSSHIMEKIKMVFFEKKKSVSTQQRKNRQRPLSYPNMLSTVETQHHNSGSSSSASPSNAPLSQTLSRQSTRHAASDEEEDMPRPLMMII